MVDQGSEPSCGGAEKSSILTRLVCGGFGRLRQAGIHHLHRMARVIAIGPTQGCV
jgi:hypothetical protein